MSLMVGLILSTSIVKAVFNVKSLSEHFSVGGQVILSSQTAFFRLVTYNEDSCEVPDRA